MTPDKSERPESPRNERTDAEGRIDPKSAVEQLIEWAVNHARNILVTQQEKELTPMFVYIDADGAITVVGLMSMGDPNEKNMIATFARKLMRDKGAVAYSFMSEAWMAVAKSRDEIRHGPAPADRPDRIECVTIMAHDDKGGAASMILKTERDASGKIMALTELVPNMSGMAGRFSNLLDPARS